jgi:hypothetical protein
VGWRDNTLPATVGVALAGALTLGACGDDDDGGGGPGVGDGPVVEVIDTGDGPRRELRLQPEVGSKVSATMNMGMQFDTVVDDEPVPTQDIPTMRMEMSMGIDDATPERIDSTFEYGDVSVGAGADPAVAANVERAMAGFKGVQGTLSTTSNGQLLEADIQTPPDLDPTLASLTSQMEDQFRSLTVPFPSEPLGLGAKWTVDSALDISGVISQLHSTYTLQDLRGKHYVLQTEVDQTIEEGEIEGAEGEIKEGQSTGFGRIEGSLDNPFPVLSEATTNSSTTIEVPAEEGDPQELEQDIAIDLRFRSRPSRGA